MTWLKHLGMAMVNTTSGQEWPEFRFVYIHDSTVKSHVVAQNIRSQLLGSLCTITILHVILNDFNPDDGAAQSSCSRRKRTSVTIYSPFSPAPEHIYKTKEECFFLPPETLLKATWHFQSFPQPVTIADEVIVRQTRECGV
jgi:hypothetical protein